MSEPICIASGRLKSTTIRGEPSKIKLALWINMNEYIISIKRLTLTSNIPDTDKLLPTIVVLRKYGDKTLVQEHIAFRISTLATIGNWMQDAIEKYQSNPDVVPLVEFKTKPHE